MTELKETDINLAKLMEKKAAAEDVLRRIEIRSPVDGQLQELKIHTEGGVVGPGDTLMLIVPDHDELIVEAMVDPKSVDQVRLGLPARVRFTSFSSSITPMLHAQLDRVSTNILTDERTKNQYYLARLRINSASLPDNLRGHLVAGMPAEVQITTGHRVAISYFFKPIFDQFARTFKEE